MATSRFEEPYRNPRTAFGGGQKTIPVGEARELQSVKVDPTIAEGAKARAAAARAGTAAPAGGIGQPPVAAAAGSRLGAVTRGLGRVALPLGIAGQALQTANTDTADYYQRTGVEPEATVVPQVVKDIGVRALGTLQDAGNNLTFGVADRVGNLVAGNGFNRSAGNQVGELPMPSAAAATVGIGAQAAPAPAGIADNVPRQPLSDARQAAAAPAPMAAQPTAASGAITRDGNSYFGNNVKAGADILGPGGNVLNTSQGKGKGFGVSSLDTSEGYRQNLLELKRNADERAAQLAQPNIIGIGGSASQGLPRTKLRTQLAAQKAANEQNNATQIRAQDIGRLTATEQMQNQRDVANIGSEGRIAAAEVRANPTVVVGGGMVEVPDGMGGAKYVTAPQRLVNRITGEEIGAKQPAKPAVTPKAEYDKMPKGARYTGPDGKPYIKG